MADDNTTAKDLETKDPDSTVEAKDDAEPKGEPVSEAEPVDIASLPKFSLRVLSHITPCQLQNGLRHNNYLRYRQYCARNLRRLRKSLKFTFGRSGKKITVPIIKPDFDDERFLLIPLMNSERAWAYAMQLKQDSEQDEENTRLRLHLVRRLKKAARWSKTFLDLCQARGDDHTQLEAAAHNGWLEALVALEYENWSDALQKFIGSEKIYRQLAQVSDVVEQSMFEKKASEIKSQIELIQYRIDLQTGKGTAKRLMELMSKMNSDSSQLLQAKLDAMLAERRKRDAATMSSITFRGTTSAVRDEKIRLKLLEAQDISLQFASCEDNKKKDQLFYDFSECCDSALKLVKKTVVDRAGGLQSEKVQLESTLLMSYIADKKLEQQMTRHSAMADEYIARYESESANESGSERSKRVRPTDLVRLHDNVLQTIVNRQELKGGQENFWENHLLQLYKNSYTARKCFYVAKRYENANQSAEALAILNHASQVIQRAEKVAELVRSKSKPNLINLKDLASKIDTAICSCKAKLILAQTGLLQNVSSDEKRFLIDRQSEFVKPSKSRTAPFMVASIPPQMQPSSCNPVTFDIIKKNIAAPTLDHRLSATVKKLPVQKSKPVENVAVKAPEARPKPEIKTPAVEEPKKKAGWFGGWWS